MAKRNSQILFPLLNILLLSVFGCAVVPKPEVASVPGQPPRISPTLKDDGKRFLKRKVAIGRFTNETKYGQGLLRDAYGDKIGKQASDILAAKLAATGKFILLERDDIERINDELRLGNLQALRIPADYLILGSVTEFGRKETSTVGVFSRTKKQVAHAKVSVRLVDVRTGQVIYADEGAGEAFSEAGTIMGLGGRAGYDSSLNDAAISSAIGKLVSDILENLLDKPWRSYILSRQDGQLIVAGGRSQGIKVGDVFGIFAKGNVVTNPQTGLPVELPGTRVANLRVERLVGNAATGEMSVCTIIEGTLPDDALENFYVQELQ